MREVSAEFYNALKNDNRDYLERVTITLTDSTVLNITNDNIWQNGLSFEDSVSQQGTFQIGAVIINKANIVLSNIYNDYDDYDFVGASVVIELGLMLGSAAEYIKIGTYTIVNEPEYNGSFIKIECLDNMYKFDKPYTTELTFPARADDVINDICESCGVVCNHIYGHGNYDRYKIYEPYGENISFREVLSYVIQSVCCDYARCNADGELVINYMANDYDNTHVNSGRVLSLKRALNKTYPPYTPYVDGEVTKNGLTFTPDYNNKTITVNGTATEDTTYTIFGYSSPSSYELRYSFKPGTYKITGSPSGSSYNTYYMSALCGNTNRNIYESGLVFELTNGLSTVSGIKINVQSGVTLNNVVFSPKIERIDGGIPEYKDIHYINELFNYNISNKDIEITGARIYADFHDDDGVNYKYDWLSGNSGYIVSIANNILLRGERFSSSFQQLAEWILVRDKYLKFRTAEVTHSSNPCIEAGDFAVVIDRKGNKYPILVSSTNFSVGNTQKTYSYAETKTTNNQNRSSAYATTEEISAKVNRDGDTMSGDLSIKKDSSPMYKQECSISGRIDAESLSAAISLGAFHRYDSNNEPVFYSETFRTPTNMLYTSFIQRRYSADGSANTSHGFYLRNLNDGTLDVAFPSNASRDAWVRGLFKSNNVTSNVVVSSNQWANAALKFTDSADAEIGRVGVYFNTSGTQYTSIRTSRIINGSTVLNEVGLRILSDGTRSIYLSDAEIWRNALGVNNTVTVKTPDPVSVASSTWTTLTNTGSLGAGTYVIRYHASFPSNATGRRHTLLATSNTSSTAFNSMGDIRNAVNGSATWANGYGIFTITSATTLYLRVWQNAGSALSCTGRIEVLKIH